MLTVAVAAGFFGRKALARRALAAAEARDAASRERAAVEEQQQATLKAEAAQRRLGELVSRFGEEAADQIVAKKLWVGAPADAVHEMFGAPADVAETVKGAHVKVVMKYFPQARGRYDLKVTVDDGRVSGWEKGSG